MSIQNDLNTLNNMKNFLGGSFIEYLKPNIKSKQNESVIKMLEIAKDKPETYLELLPVAIFHRNIEIIKYMVEHCKITEADSPYMKASSFYNAILPDDSKDKINDSKDYLDVQIPFIIMSGIGGDIEIFNYLLKHKLISKKDQIGVIGLSKKYKNSFSSNVIGACAYYGQKDLLEFLLRNYKNELKINVTTTEKKVKNTKYSFSKEYLGSTPCLLAMEGPSSDTQTLEILKILKNYGANFEAVDFNKDNLLHMATKLKKIESAKYIVEELNMKNLVGEINKDKYTPLSLAQHLNAESFISYFTEKNKIDEKEIEENVMSLINEDYAHSVKQSKKKKKKKGKNYLQNKENQENLKEEKKEESNEKKTDNLPETQESKNENEIKDNNDNNNEDEKKENEELIGESKEEDEKKESEKEEKEEKEVKEEKEEKEEKGEKENKKIESKKENQKSKIVKKSENGEKTESKTKIEQKEIIGLTTKKTKKKQKQLAKLKANEEEEKSANNEKEEGKDEKKVEEKKEASEPENKSKLRSKKEKRIDKDNDEIEKERKRREEEEKEEEQRKKEEEEKEREEQRKKEEERKREELRKKEERRKREEERKRREEERKRREEEERKKREEEEEKERKRKEEEERKRREEEEEKMRKEEEERKRREEEEERKRREEEEEEEEKEVSKSEEENIDNQISEKEEEANIEITKKEYDQLNNNYLQLEKKLKNLEKEKMELTSCLTKLYLENKENSKIPPSSNNEENINDLMYLANKEIEEKNRIINELEEKKAMLDLKNIQNFSNEKLKMYKEFYVKNLEIIEDALKKA